MDDTPTTLVVAERDDSTRAFLLDNLAADGYEPLGAQTEEEPRLKLGNHGPALLLLGRLGEERQTLTRLQAIRSGAAGGDPTLPMIVLGDGDDQLELLRAFEACCDHFVPKPLSRIELAAGKMPALGAQTIVLCGRALRARQNGQAAVAAATAPPGPERRAA